MSNAAMITMGSTAACSNAAALGRQAGRYISAMLASETLRGKKEVKAGALEGGPLEDGDKLQPSKG